MYVLPIIIHVYLFQVFPFHVQVDVIDVSCITLGLLAPNRGPADNLTECKLITRWASTVYWLH